MIKKQGPGARSSSSSSPPLLWVDCYNSRRLQAAISAVHSAGSLAP
ncbi:MAG TPA: hypothetical protein VIJ58_00595 [Candidatus Dormibacteraeota bacterium]